MIYQRSARLTFLLGLLSLFAVTDQQVLIPNGSQQFYEVENKVLVTDVKQSSKEQSGYIFNTKLKVNSVWHSDKEQLLEAYFTESTVSALAKGSDKLVTQAITQIPDRPFYISLVNGIPHNIVAHTSRDQSLLNLERGIASLLQLRYNTELISEKDVSGQCNVFYNVKSSTRIEKTKTDCSHWDLRVNYRSEKPLSVIQNSIEQVVFNLAADGTLLSVHSSETHHLALEAKPDAGSQLESHLVLKHTSVGDDKVEQLKYATLDEAIKSLLEWYRVFDIEADVDGSLSEIKHTTLTKEIELHSDQLSSQYFGEEYLAHTFAKLLPIARITKETEFVEILKNHEELYAYLVDLYGAVQTIDAHNAIHKHFKYDEELGAFMIEKYMQSLAVGTHPEREIIYDLFRRLQDSNEPFRNENLYASLVQTVAALARHSGLEPHNSLMVDIRGFILKQIQTDCNGAACQILFIRGLQNLKDASTIQVLFTNVFSTDTAVSIASMQALQDFPVVHFNETHRKIFSNIFYQCERRFDSSVRIMALDILLSMKPTKAELGELLDYLISNDSQFEIKTYVIQKLRLLAEKCSRFQSILYSCLRERPTVHNYDVIAQKGLTTVLMRQLSQSPAFNESLLSVQEINKGVLKRGSVELVLSAGREEINTFKLGIHTSGLTSFVGDSGENDEDITDDSSATAGMEISVQGTLLRPLVFFTGQSELMGHVWSGTASEPTPAYQATYLTHDHEHYVIMSSGATVYMRVIGARSVDLNGRVELSIWNRNANTEIQKNSASAVVGLMVAGFTYAKVENEFALLSEPKLSLQANIDFYSGIKLCIQLQRAEMTLKHIHTKAVHLNANKKYTKTVKHKSIYKFPGRTFALNQKNNDMCNMIFES